MAFEKENANVNIRIPDVDIVIKTCRKKQVLFFMPVQAVNALAVT